MKDTWNTDSAQSFLDKLGKMRPSLWRPVFIPDVFNVYLSVSKRRT